MFNKFLIFISIFLIFSIFEMEMERRNKIYIVSTNQRIYLQIKIFFKMPKFFCEYCEINLKNDSPGVRKQHNLGRKHKENVRFYYEQFLVDETQKRLDQTVQSFFATRSYGMPMPHMFYPMPGMSFPGVTPPMYPLQGMNGAVPLPTPMYPPPGVSPISHGMNGAQAIQPSTSAAVSYSSSKCPPTGVPPPTSGMSDALAVQPDMNCMTSIPANMNGVAQLPTAASNITTFPLAMGGAVPFPLISYPPITASPCAPQHTASNYRPHYEQSRCSPYERTDNRQNNFHATGYNYNAVQ